MKKRAAPAGPRLTPALSPAELRKRSRTAGRMLRSCALCPRSCGVDRRAGERGFCGAGIHPRVAAVSIHHGEEPPISGSGGSGNVFFTGCNLSCIFCQNYPISRLGVGRDTSVGGLADSFLRLQRRGAHNVNLVSPTPWVPQILEALALARERGLSLPVVYNTGGYDSVEALRLLEGAVEIYLPDMKYDSDAAAWRFSRARGYRAANHAAVAEMLRQAGPLHVGDDGIALGGVLVRHLVLPGGKSGAADVLAAMRRLSADLPVSLMFQYFPAHRAVGHPLLGRPLWREECAEAEGLLRREPAMEGWVQDYG